MTRCREWFSTAHFTWPAPADISALRAFFPTLQQSTSIVPSTRGASVTELHDRCAYALARIVADVDAASSSEESESIVISSHAAPIIAMARALTGLMPEDTDKVDFHTYTCCISKFVRKQAQVNEQLPSWHHGDAIPVLNWRNGKGVGGGWVCEVNAGVDHLSNGGERNW